MADLPIIETRDLHKRFHDVSALCGLDLDVRAGSIYGLLRRNGAGKTTTLKILLGMTKPTSGTARVFGLAANAADESVNIRRRTAFVSEDKSLYGFMTVSEMVRFTSRFFPRWRSDLEEGYLRSFELPPSRPVKALSRGMRTKLALLLALCRSAELLILDEPTSGLDPAVTEEVLQALVAYVGREEATVFLSSHQIAEVEQVADHVAIVDHGRALVAGALDDLRESFRRIQLVFSGDAPAAAFKTPGVQRVERAGRVLTVHASAGVEAILDEARALGPVSVDVAPVTLKEIFLETVHAEEA